MLGCVKLLHTICQNRGLRGERGREKGWKNGRGNGWKDGRMFYNLSESRKARRARKGLKEAQSRMNVAEYAFGILHWKYQDGWGREKGNEG